jgi:hypothetical protein
MSGRISNHIAHIFRNRFEENCQSLLLHAFTTLSFHRNLEQDLENDITAQLIGIMKLDPNRKKLNISVDREHYLDSAKVYAGEEHADTSPRIDMKYHTWNKQQEIEYFMEAKLLAENNFVRDGNTTPVNAAKLRERYISTGIDNFCSQRYPSGCLVGYIVEGSIFGIVSKINDLLIKRQRNGEKMYVANTSTPEIYISNHAIYNLKELKHLLLCF